MRIAHVVADLEGAKGGPVTAIVGLARAQIQAGHAVRIVTTDNGWHGAVAGVPVDVFHSWDRKWRFSPQLARGAVATARDSDLVHLHGLWDFPILAAANACRRAGTPYVVTLHGMLNAVARGDRSWRKRGYLALAGGSILRHATLLHFTSASESANAAAAGFSHDSFVCPFGTDLPPLREGSAAFRERHGLAADDRIVLFAGRLHPQKQIELLMASFARIARDIGTARLVLAGAGDAAYSRALAERARRLAGKRIVFCGALEAAEIREAYAACDVLALPSIEESFGLSALEAMAAARPVIVTPGVGLASAIAKAGAGIVVDSSEEAIAHGIAGMLRNCDDRRRMGTAARRLVESAYAWPRVVAALEERYARAAAVREPGP